MDYEVLLIARHGRLSERGAIREVAQSLAKTVRELNDSPWPIAITAIEHADTQECHATAEAYAAALELRPTTGCAVALGPDEFPPHRREDTAGAVRRMQQIIDARLAAERSQLRSDCDDRATRAMLLVGHQPAIDWLLDGCLARGTVLPALASAEIACLARMVPDPKPSTRESAASPPWRHHLGRWHLWWVLTPSKAGAIEQLRTKLTSKMVVLSVLAGFSLAAAATVLVTLPDGGTPRVLAGVSAGSLLLAAGVYVSVLLAYDELMMPPRFWRARRYRPSSLSALRERLTSRPGPLGGGTVARPPSSAGIVIFQHMVALWRWVIVALAVSGIGMFLLALAEFRMHRLLVGVVAAVTALVGATWWLSHQPRVGSED